MTRGFQHRLMWPYMVVRRDSYDDVIGAMESGSLKQPPAPLSPKTAHREADNNTGPEKACESSGETKF